MQNVDLFFLLLGAVLVLAMHAGFAFLELGTVRHKNQVNALSKILTDFAISAIAYFFIGYWIAYGQNFFHAGSTLASDHGYNLMRCFLPANLCRSHSRDYFRRYCRTCQDALASDCDPASGGADLSLL